jgi:outer membrane protein assembly factor BamB
MKLYSSFLILISSTSLLLLQGCSTAKEPLSGQRTEILPASAILEKDAEAESIEVQIEDPTLNTDWSQADYNATHKIPHLEAGDLKNIVWKTSIGQGNTRTGFLLSTPLIENEIIYTLDTGGRIKAKNLQTGKEVWQHRLEMRSRREDCSGGGIALGDGKIFATFSSADVVALDSSNGMVIWHITLPHSIRSAPTFYKGFLYLITKNNRIICLNALTGEKMWQQEGSEHSCSLVGGGKPAIQYDTVIAPYSSGELYALRRENGFPLWAESLSALKVFSSSSIVSHIKASPVIDKDMVFALSQSGRMVGVDYRSGNVIWEREIHSTSTPVVHGNFIFMVTSDHQAVCMVRHSGKIVWVTQLPGYGVENKTKISYSGPILAGHKLIITSSSGKALFLKPETGENIDQLNLPAPCYLPPIVANKVAYFLTESGTLVAVE